MVIRVYEWVGTIAKETRPTTDHRLLRLNALTWRIDEDVNSLKIYLLDENGKPVGTVDEVWREGIKIKARGTVTVDGDVSIVFSPLAIDIDAIEADSVLGGEALVIKSGRIRAVRFTSKPGWRGVRIETLKEIEQVAEPEPVQIDLSRDWAESLSRVAEAVNEQAARREVVYTVMQEWAQAIRGDWVSIDGRSIRSQVDEFVQQLREPSERSLEEWRVRLGICTDGQGHWERYCDDYGCDPEEPRGATDA